MFKQRLNQLIRLKNSLVCVGLDTDIEQIPPSLLNEKDPLLKFNQEIIEATQDLAIAYKLNVAFYESLGIPGWELLEKTLQFIDEETIVIADAKCCDIGNSARKYAETFFKTYPFHALTVSPYMGADSIYPFLEFQSKGVFILCLTSNPGALDFQYLHLNGDPLYLKVAQVANEWNLEYGNCGLVVGATHPEDIHSIREAAPTLPFLIPGVGKQGGNLELSVSYGTDELGENALISSSRAIIYAGTGKEFAQKAREAAMELRERINAVRAQNLDQGLLGLI